MAGHVSSHRFLRKVVELDGEARMAVARKSATVEVEAAEGGIDPSFQRAILKIAIEVPKTWFFVNAVEPNSGRFVLPIGIAPAARRRATWVESCGATAVRHGAEPCVVGK